MKATSAPGGGTVAADAPTAVEIEMPTSAESPGARASDGPRRAATAEGADAGARTRPGLSPSTSGTHSPTALRALKDEELTRTRNFALMVVLAAVVAFVCQSFVRSLGWPTWLMRVALFGAIVGGSIVWWKIRKTRRPEPLMWLLGLTAVATSIVLQYYSGIFSPAPMLIVIGISFFGLAGDLRFGLYTCVAAALGYLLVALLVTTGLIPDLSLFPSANLPLSMRVVGIPLVMTIYGITLWQARTTRRATHAAIERLDEALRLVQQREALLDEANQNLEVALDADGGRRGPYSGARAGPYQIGEVIGRGAMGEVYAATDGRDASRVAVKLLHGRALANRDIVQRFLRESDIATRLRVPNVVTIHEVGQAQDGAPFIAMELLSGHDLGWLLRRKRRLALADVVEMAVQIARGLEAAHEGGIIHRDLKPPNLFRCLGGGRDTPLWKILDFGVAKLRGSGGTLTQRAVVGTPGYMSPEQAQAREVDARSDLFSLGAVVYRALTGQPPFSGPDTPQTLFDICFKSPARPCEVAPDLPADVDLVLAIALAKRRDDRFAHALELAEALDAASRNELPPVLRSRGAAQVRALPWGRTVEGRKLPQGGGK
jgi:hypothetical protein